MTAVQNILDGFFIACIWTDGIEYDANGALENCRFFAKKTAIRFDNSDLYAILYASCKGQTLLDQTSAPSKENTMTNTTSTTSNASTIIKPVAYLTYDESVRYRVDGVPVVKVEGIHLDRTYASVLILEDGRQYIAYDEAMWLCGKDKPQKVFQRILPTSPRQG